MSMGILDGVMFRHAVVDYGPALGLSVLVHAIVVAVLIFNWQNKPEIAALKPDPYYIAATTVAQNPHRARQQQTLQTAEERRQQRLARVRAERAAAAEAEAARRQQNEQRIAEENAARRAQLLAIQSQLKAVDTVVATRAQSDDSSAELRQTLEDQPAPAVAAEPDARMAVTDDEKAMAYASRIRLEVEQMWSRPPTARNGMQVLLQVHLVPTGEVVDVHVLSSSGNDAFDRSAIQAVRKADRFVVPADSRLFERKFRVLELLFRPEDLRL